MDGWMGGWIDGKMANEWVDVYTEYYGNERRGHMN